jgi:hypothetical protein
MKKINREMVVQFAFVVATLMLVASVALVGFQIYVRWSINQDFTFLGGWGLEALLLSMTALILGLLYTTKN